MNIINKIKLLYRLNEIWQKAKEDSKMNWKTTLFGILASLPQLWQWLMPQLNMEPTLANAITGIMVAIAFYFSKDKNVTGGTVQQ
jgi:hypothetical protein